MYTFLYGSKRLVQIKKYFLLFSVFTLTACSTPINPPSTSKEVIIGSTIGAIGGGLVLASPLGVSVPIAAWFGGVTGAALGHHQNKAMTLLKEIQNNEVQVVLIGDSVRLILPVDKFFTPNAASFNTYSFPILKKIAKFLSYYPKINVKVSGYTDNQGTPERNLALTQNWAQMIADYLWTHGLDARLIYSQGYGSCQAVANNTTFEGRKTNRRIEISLHRLVPQTL
ncbi:MAG: Peptidoglycan-associated lipoprotein [Legionellaceae bacterium]